MMLMRMTMIVLMNEDDDSHIGSDGGGDDA